MTPHLDIIIVNWNAGNQLYECLKSIEATRKAGFKLNRVVVVDNSSTDGSAERLDDISLPLTVIHNPGNRGFAAACNQGAKDSKADYLLFLNPDTRLFKDSLIKPLVSMEQAENKKIGIVGIQLIDETNQVSRTCARFPTPTMFFSKMFGLDRLFPALFPSHLMTEWDHSNRREVEQIMGAFFLIRHPLFEELSGFDERFFVYFEEVDFSFRARKLDWCSFYFADTQAYHKGGGTSEQVKATRLFYSLRSRIQYGFKHFGLTKAIIFTVGTIIFEPVSRIIFGLIRFSMVDLETTLKAYMKLWHWLFVLLISKLSRT